MSGNHTSLLRSTVSFLYFLGSLSFALFAYPDVSFSQYCRSFQPSISYLTIPIPKALQIHDSTALAARKAYQPKNETERIALLNSGPVTVFSKEALRYAALNNFIEQLAISALAKDDAFIASLQTMPQDQALKDALGLGGIGTRLVEPGNDNWDPEEIDLQLQDDEGALAFTDAPNILYFSTGLVKKVVQDAIAHNFGGVEAYKKHLKVIIEEENLWSWYTPDDNHPTDFPIGQLYYNANSDNRDTVFKPMWKFSRELVGSLMFIGAHETGHIRNHDPEKKPATCSEFLRIERHADEFAADVFAEYNFNMDPVSGSSSQSADLFSFLKYFNETGLNGVDPVTGCQYLSAEARLKHVSDYYFTDYGLMQRETFSAVDYTADTPTEAICTNMEGYTWRQPVK